VTLCSCDGRKAAFLSLSLQYGTFLYNLCRLLVCFGCEVQLQSGKVTEWNTRGGCRLEATTPGKAIWHPDTTTTTGSPARFPDAACFGQDRLLACNMAPCSEASRNTRCFVSRKTTSTLIALLLQYAHKSTLDHLRAWHIALRPRRPLGRGSHCQSFLEAPRCFRILPHILEATAPGQAHLFRDANPATINNTTRIWYSTAACNEFVVNRCSETRGPWSSMSATYHADKNAKPYDGTSRHQHADCRSQSPCGHRDPGSSHEKHRPCHMLMWQVSPVQ